MIIYKNMIDIDFYQPEQPHFGALIQPFQKSKGQGKEIIISGFPYDEGTKRNGGRVGGHIASTIFRKTLQEIDLYAHKPLKMYDSGDISSEVSLEQAHIQLYQKHKEILSTNKERVLFSIGGSNDQSYPNVRSLIDTYPEAKLGVINLDSHFDVRPLKNGLAHSGSPFRLMLQHQKFLSNGSKFVEFGTKGATCAHQHSTYLKEKGAQIYWLQKDIRLYELRKNSSYLTQGGQLFQQILNGLSVEADYIFVSFDVDSINSKWMPGVSAPSVIGGLSAQEAVEIMEITGKNNKVKLIDCSEFNPAVESLMSSRVLGEMFYGLAMGLCERQVE